MPNSPHNAHSIEARLLLAAYERKRLNLLMTAAAMALVVATVLKTGIFPSRLMWPWAVAVLLCTALGWVESRAFRRAAPAAQDLTPALLLRWQRIFIAQALLAGAAWALGPVLLVGHVQSAELALLASLLLCVCAVAMTSVAEQREAMQAFLLATLLPVALAMAFNGDTVQRMLAMVLLGGMALMIVVGRNAHQAMRTLLETQLEMRAMLDASQDAVVGIDDRGLITDWNLKAQTVFDRSPQESLGQAFEAVLIPQRHRASYREALAQFLAHGDEGRMNRRIETTALRRNGEEFPAEVAITPLKSGRKHRFTAFIADITERKAAESRLALFRRVFDASGQLISILDGDGKALYQNRAHALELGYSDEEIRGRHFSLTVAPESMTTLPEELRKAMLEDRRWTGQLTLRRKDGSRFIANNNIGFIQDEAGNVQYGFNIFSDFSAELARRNELAQAKEEAERANAAKSDFLSSMSHELRTPMNAIIGFAQMLEFDAGLNADQQDNVQEILKAGRHLLELINEVLDLAKIEAGHANLSLEAVDLGLLIDDCRQLLQPLAAQRQIRMHLPVPEHTLVHADRVRLKQVLLNLLSNAVKYNREGGDITLTVQALAESRMRITVTDTGAGIAPERIAELFQPFNRLDAAHGEIEGTGIGLTITRRLMLMMGGTVGVDSRPGIGSSFWIELPGAEIRALDTAAGPAPGPAEPDRPGGRASLVLCIDDNPVNLKLMAQFFGLRPDIELLTATGPEAGIELALARRPDLVVLDINMPGLDGYQVLALLKAHQGLASVPVIAVTANAMPRDIARGEAAGFAAYLTKPLDARQFLDTVRHCLQPDVETPHDRTQT
ncbi:MAG: PAS domain S-box protein [Burkholderiaceae bacterium]|nr:PAS domain S-box protein [Burkholderiaceae bacterium]